MRVTEDYIKSVLDGTFTTIDCYGHVNTTSVDAEEEQSIVSTGGRPKGSKNRKPQVFWTDAEDELLWRMKAQGRPFNEIAWVLDRTEEATKKHYKLLKVKKSGIKEMSHANV